jgi:predicted PurR-regulated permease PerM
MNNKLKIDISTWMVVKIILIILGFWFLYAIREEIVLFFITLVVVAALAPLVDKASRFIPRVIAVIILSILVLGALVGIGFLIIPPMIEEIRLLAINLPIILNKFGPFYQAIQNSIANYQQSLFSLSSQIGSLTSGIYSTTLSFFSGIIAFLTILVLSFYMLLEKEILKKFLDQNLNIDHKERLYDLFRKIAVKLGSWVRGQLLLMIIVGVLDGIALVVLGVPYALVLAVWGGLTEVVPYIGPWLGLLPAFIIAFTISPITAVLVLIVYIVIQQLESQFLVPKVMGKAVGLSPVIIILAILAGAKLMGILGIIIAVPIAAGISVLIQEWPNLKTIREMASVEKSQESNNV